MRKAVINPAKYDKRVTIQTQIETDNEDGDTGLDWHDFKTVWASMHPMRGKQYTESKKLRPELTFKITIRYSQKIIDEWYKNNIGLRLKYGTRRFEIMDIIDPDEANTELEIMCVEKVDKVVGEY